MQKRHTDRESYFGEQSQTSKNYYIPYIKEVIGHIPDKVLEAVSYTHLTLPTNSRV